MYIPVMFRVASQTSRVFLLPISCSCRIAFTRWSPGWVGAFILHCNCCISYGQFVQACSHVLSSTMYTISEVGNSFSVPVRKPCDEEQRTPLYHQTVQSLAASSLRLPASTERTLKDVSKQSSAVQSDFRQATHSPKQCSSGFHR